MNTSKRMTGIYSGLKVGIFLLLTALLTVSCHKTGTSANRQPDKRQQKPLTFCESWRFDGGFSVLQEPLTANGTFGLLYYIGNFYETLINYDDGKIVPGLAESWSISEDNRTYTFHLYKNIRFSDGEELTAETVKKNFDTIAKNLGAYNGFFGLTSTLIQEVTAIDRFTVSVRLSSPYYGALTDFTLPLPLGIMSSKAFNDDGSLSEAVKTATLGTGPYMYNGIKSNDTYTFVKNPYYDRKSLEFDSFAIKIIPDNNAKLLALRSGEIDMIIGARNLSYDSYSALSKDSSFRGKNSKTVIQTRYIGMNTDKVPFNDLKVRRAVNYAINTEAIRLNIFGNIEKKAECILDKALPFCNIESGSYGYSPEKAAALLDEAGWLDTDGDGIREKDGVTLSADISCASDQAMLQDVIAAVAADLKRVGFAVHTSSAEMMIFFKNVAEGKYGMAMGITYNIPMDPYRFISTCLKNPAADAMTAKSLVSMPYSDELITRLNALTDTKEIQAVYAKLLQGLHNDAVLVPLSRTVGMALYNAKTIADYMFYYQPDYLDVAGIKRAAQ